MKVLYVNVGFFSAQLKCTANGMSVQNMNVHCIAKYIWSHYVFDCSSMSAIRMLFQRANTIKLHYICLYIVERIEMQIAPVIWYSCENSSFGVKQHSLAQYAWNKVNVKTRTGPCLWFCFLRAGNVGRSKHGTRYGSCSVVFIITYGEGIFYLPLDVTWWVPLYVEPCWEP